MTTEAVDIADYDCFKLTAILLPKSLLF